MAAVTKYGETDVPFSTLFCDNVVAHATNFVIAPEIHSFSDAVVSPCYKENGLACTKHIIFVPSSQPFTFDMLGNWQLSTDGAN